MFRRAGPTLLLFAVCGGLFLAQTCWFRQHHSLTFDETLYLSLSVRSVRAGAVDPGFVNSGIAPLPMILTYFPSLWLEPGADRHDGWAGQVDDPRRIRRPRLANAVLMGVPLLAIVFFWLLRRCGLPAATAGGLLLACSPTFLAHGSLATTEMTYALWSLISLLLLARLKAGVTWRRLLLAGGAIGVALAAKYSSLFLLPTAGICLVSCELSAGHRAFRPSAAAKVLSRYAVLACTAAVVCWGGHAFTTAGPLKAHSLQDTAEYSPWLRVLGRGPLADWIMTTAHERLSRPAPLEGLLFQMRHNAEGHPAYLCGERSTSGWWYYFPLAFVFKSTLVELLLLGALCSALWMSPRSLLTRFRRLDAVHFVWLWGGLILLSLLLTARINIGQRYLILFYPLLVMTGVERLMTFRVARPRCVTCVAALLIAGQFVSAGSIGPHYLAYFNAVVGGPDRGRRLLTDSNLDWGQDLPALREFQEQHPGPLLLWYFGTALPEAYGVRATNLEEFPTTLERFDYAALSASLLMGPYGPVQGTFEPFAPLRSVPAVDVCGYSIVILDLRLPGVREQLSRAIRQFEQMARNNPRHNPPRWRSSAEPAA